MKPGALEKVLDYNFSINADILWFILSIVTFGFIIFSLMLFYHWNRFGRRAVAVSLAEAIYLAGSIFFILGAAASVVLF